MSGNDDACTFDDVGVLLAGVEAAHNYAMQALANCSRGILPSAVRRVLAVELRNEEKQALLELRLVFHAASSR
jgi:non-ribosomal peptide synthetase component E (peptide arylation enzyme)